MRQIPWGAKARILSGAICGIRRGEQPFPVTKPDSASVPASAATEEIVMDVRPELAKDEGGGVYTYIDAPL